MTQGGVVFYPLDSRDPSRKPGSACLSVHLAAQAVFSRKVCMASGRRRGDGLASASLKGTYSPVTTEHGVVRAARLWHPGASLPPTWGSGLLMLLPL